MKSKSFNFTLVLVRNAMPHVFSILTLLNYLLCGIVTGMYITSLMSEQGVLGIILGYGTGLISQLIRGAIIFSGQLNPHQSIQNPLPHYILACTLGAIAILEVTHIVPTAGLMLSFSVLIGMGVIIEIITVKQFTDFTNYEIISDPKKKEQLKDSMIAMDEYKELRSALLTDSGKDVKELFKGRTESEKEVEEIKKSAIDELVLDFLKQPDENGNGKK